MNDGNCENYLERNAHSSRVTPVQLLSVAHVIARSKKKKKKYIEQRQCFFCTDRRIKYANYVAISLKC